MLFICLRWKSGTELASEPKSASKGLAAHNFIYQERCLNYDRFLIIYNIPNQFTFQLGGFEVRVVKLTGEVFTLWVVEREEIEGIKGEIQDITSILIDQQKLVFASRQLEDGRILADYEIHAGATPNLEPRLRGGWYQVHITILYCETRLDIAKVRVLKSHSVKDVKKMIAEVHFRCSEKRTMSPS